MEKSTVIKNEEPVRCLAVGGEGKTLFLGGHNFLSRYDLDTATRSKKVPFNRLALRMVLSKDEMFLFVGCDISNPFTVAKIKSDTLEKLQDFRGHSGSVRALLALDSLSTIISSSEDNTIIIWNLRFGSLQKTLKEHVNQVDCLISNASETKFFSGSWDCQVIEWGTSKFTRINKYPSDEPIGSLVLTPDEKSLIIGGKTKISMLKLAEGVKKFSIKAHSDLIRSISLFGEYLISCSDDKSIRVAKFDNPKDFGLFKSHTGAVTQIQVLPDGRILSVAMDQTCRITPIEAISLTGSSLSASKAPRSPTPPPAPPTPSAPKAAVDPSARIKQLEKENDEFRKVLEDMTKEIEGLNLVIKSLGAENMALKDALMEKETDEK